MLKHHRLVAVARAGPTKIIGTDLLHPATVLIVGYVNLTIA